MALRHSARLTLACIAATALYVAVSAAPAMGQEESSAALTLASGRVSLAGTSNIHAYTASSTAVRVTRVLLGSGPTGPEFWDGIVTPGAVEAFDIAIAAATLASPKGDLDKNMHKALKVTEHPDIVFRLRRLEPRPGDPGGLRGARGAPDRRRREGSRARPHDRAQGRLADRARAGADPDDRLRHQAPDRHARHVEDRSEGHRHVRSGTGDSR